MDLISVIVPIYNTEAYLQRCIDSILEQTYENLQIILVDDGSPDGCPQICDEICKTDSRITVIHQSNTGQGLARNAGLQMAAGKYVTFIDSDDWISCGHIENLYRAITVHQADAAIGSHTAVASDGSMMEARLSFEERVYSGDEILEQIVLPLIGTDLDAVSDVAVESSSSMTLYRMKTIRDNQVSYISERFAVAEDLVFNIDFFVYAERVAVVNETGYYYFENINSTSRKYDPNRFIRTCNFYRVLQERIERFGLAEQIGFRIERTFLMKIRVAIRLIANSDMSLRKKLHRIRMILHHALVVKVLQSYPVETYPPGHRILAHLMRRGNAGGVYLLVKLRDILSRFGIGK